MDEALTGPWGVAGFDAFAPDKGAMELVGSGFAVGKLLIDRSPKEVFL